MSPSQFARVKTDFTFCPLCKSESKFKDSFKKYLRFNLDPFQEICTVVVKPALLSFSDYPSLLKILRSFQRERLYEGSFCELIEFLCPELAHFISPTDFSSEPFRKPYSHRAQKFYDLCWFLYLDD